MSDFQVIPIRKLRSMRAGLPIRACVFARPDALDRIPAAVGDAFWQMEVIIADGVPDIYEDADGNCLERIGNIHCDHSPAGKPIGTPIGVIVGDRVELSAA